MRTHRYIQWFLFCSGGERSVKCVRPALEKVASKEEQSGVVHFLVAEGAARVIKSKRLRMLSDGIILLHDNACPLTANLARDKLQSLEWETQHPPYNPDLSPCNFQFLAI